MTCVPSRYFGAAHGDVGRAVPGCGTNSFAHSLNARRKRGAATRCAANAAFIRRVGDRIDESHYGEFFGAVWDLVASPTVRNRDTRPVGSLNFSPGDLAPCGFDLWRHLDGAAALYLHAAHQLKVEMMNWHPVSEVIWTKAPITVLAELRIGFGAAARKSLYERIVACRKIQVRNTGCVLSET